MYCCVCLYTYVYVYAYMFVCTCGCLACIYIYLYVLVACYSISDLFGEIRTSYRRPGPDSGSCRCGPDTMGIRRPMHGMVRRPVPVRAVKTRRRFGSETASFHVSVRFCVFTVVGMPYMLILSFHVTFRYILSV